MLEKGQAIDIAELFTGNLRGGGEQSADFRRNFEAASTFGFQKIAQAFF
jgi:hypothetical protein